MITNPITDAEHAGRIAALRDALDRQGLDAIVLYGAHRDYQPADLRYFARWYCVEEETAALFVSRDGPVVLMTTAGWDVERAQAEAYADDMRLTRDMGADLAELVREHGGCERAGGDRGLRVLPGARVPDARRSPSRRDAHRRRRDHRRPADGEEPGRARADASGLRDL